MSSPAEVFRIRMELDGKRQPSCAGDIATMWAAFTSLSPAPSANNYESPYSVHTADWTALIKQTPTYYSTAKGIPTASCDDHYLYSIAAFSRVIGRPNTRSPRIAAIDPTGLYRKLVRGFRADGTWFPLSDLIEGTYSGLRLISWWTRRTPDLSNVLAQAYTVGLARDWIAANSLVLRWRPSTTTPKVKIPTCVDAFYSPIFLSVSEVPTPTAGIAIDLRSFPLKRGHSEYVVAPIEATDIEFAPIEVLDPDEARFKDALWPQLSAFYKAEVVL
jgi:hypothetical protein